MCCLGKMWSFLHFQNENQAWRKCAASANTVMIIFYSFSPWSCSDYNILTIRYVIQLLLFRVCFRSSIPILRVEGRSPLPLAPIPLGPRSKGSTSNWSTKMSSPSQPTSAGGFSPQRRSSSSTGSKSGTLRINYLYKWGPCPLNFQSHKQKCVFNKRTIKVCVSYSGW